MKCSSFNSLKRFIWLNECLIQPCSQHNASFTTINNIGESWCISKVNSCRSWLTNHRRFNFTTRNVQTLKLLLTRFITCLQTKRLLIMCLQKCLYILNGLLNLPSQLICQYFILVQVSLFASILPLQIFPRTVCR